MNKRRTLGNSGSPGSWVSPGEALICTGSEARSPVRACVGLCIGCLGPHSQSMPACSGIRCEGPGKSGVSPMCLSHLPSAGLSFLEGGQMLPLMRTQGLGLQPGCPVSLETREQGGSESNTAQNGFQIQTPDIWVLKGYHQITPPAPHWLRSCCEGWVLKLSWLSWTARLVITCVQG